VVLNFAETTISMVSTKICMSSSSLMIWIHALLIGKTSFVIVGVVMTVLVGKTSFSLIAVAMTVLIC